jgi:hypothetical protein
MHRSRKNVLAVVCGLAAALAVAPATATGNGESSADEPVITSAYDGPLRSRDTSPLGFLRLDMRPAAATTQPAPGTWSFESDMAYQNTWALTKKVEDYLQTLDGRRTLGPMEIDAIRALPGENYLVDLEYSHFDFVAYRQLTRHWGAYGILSGVHYGGGFDGVIESFHSGVGATDYGRESVTRGQANVVLDLKASQEAIVNANPTSGLLDPTLGVRYTGLKLPEPWGLALEGAVKVPVGGARPWLSTGRADVGVQASVSRTGARHAFHGNVGLVQYTGSDDVTQPRAPRLLPTLVAGLESRVTHRTNSIVQLYVSPSVYGGRETDLSELRATKIMLGAGLRHRRGPHMVTAAIMENVGNTRHTPDLALQLSWAFHPGRR